jgi:hypothetical protein
MKAMMRTLFKGKRTKPHTPVGVVFHLLFNEGLFGETEGELLIEARKVRRAGEVAPLQRKNAVDIIFGSSEPAVATAAGISLDQAPVRS